MIRALAALALLALPTGPAFAQPAEDRPAAAAAVAADPAATVRQRAVLRPELTLSRDLISLGDLVAGLPAESAAVPAFRAPALGETGTIQVARITEAVRAAGLVREAAEIQHSGFAQVVVTRAARRLTAGDLEQAVKTGLQERFGLDSAGFALAIDGGAPALVVEPELTGEVAVLDLNYDARSRRVMARIVVPGSATLRLKPARIAGQLLETIDVVVPRRSIARGETLAAEDVAVERRARDGLPGELIADLRGAADKVARRALPAGVPLRTADVQREEIVGKGDLVTIVYEAPGLMITLRGRAGEAGAMGDSVSVTNPQSKRVLQGTVTGPGRISVQAVSAGRVAAVR